MAQFHVLSNFYKINSLASFQAILQVMQEISGNLLEGDRTTYEINVAGNDNTAHLYKLTFIKHQELGEGVSVWLGGKELINDPMHGLRSAEELMQTIIELRMFNTRHTDPAIPGYSNFYQVYDTLSWLEVAASLRPYGDIEAGDEIVIKTSATGIDTGVYTLKKVVTDQKAGIEVSLDGAPLYNYPKPLPRTAEQMVDVIKTLKDKFALGCVGAEFSFNAENPKPLVATVKDGQNEIRLFSNGTITITGPGVMKVVTMADADASKATELMEKILDLTINQ